MGDKPIVSIDLYEEEIKSSTFNNVELFLVLDLEVIKNAGYIC